MSGHSKWSKVKHQKAVTDVVKAAAFTRASRAITIAVKEGGGITDPNANFRLRLAVEKAREANVPNDNIKRAISKAKEKDQETLSEVLYEGYGPGGVALIIEGATDNSNRTVSAIKNILDHNSGRLVAQGAISHLFSKKGILLIPKSAKTYDEIFSLGIEAGAQDILETLDVYEVYTDLVSLSKVRNYFDQQHIPITAANVIYYPETGVTLSPEQKKVLETLREQLEELADVQQVYSNEIGES